jgi:TRAP-type C4-dicarboxylate transport system permease small subunit
MPNPYPFPSRIAKAELYVAGFAFVVMLAVIVVNVSSRYFFSTSVLSAEEVAYMGFNWSTFAAVPYLYRTRGLIAVEFFFDILPRPLQRGFSVIVNIALIAANMWFTWLAWLLASGGWIRKTPVLEIPYFWINLAPVLAFALMTIYSAVHFVEGLRHGPDPSHDPEHDAKLYEDTAL